MKEQWKAADKQQLAALEEGRIQEQVQIKQIQIKKFGYGNNCSLQYFHLILFLAWLLFCGLCFYLTYQNLYSEQMETQISNTVRNVFREWIDESQAEMQKSQPNTEIEDIINKFNNLLEATNSIKEQEQDTKRHKTITSDYLSTILENLYENMITVHNKNLKRISTWKIKQYGDIIDNDAESPLHEAVEKQHDTYSIFNVKISDILDPENENFGDNNRLTLNILKKDASNVDISNKLDTSRSDDSSSIVMTLDFTDLLNRKAVADPMNYLQDPEQKFSDLMGETEPQEDQSDNSSFSDLIDDENVLDINAFYSSSFREFPDLSNDDSSISQPILTRKISRSQIKNTPSLDTDITNEDGYHIDDSNLSISDVPSLRNKIFLLCSSANRRNQENQPMTNLPVTEQVVREDDKDKSRKNFENSFEFWLPPPTMEDSMEKYAWKQRSDIERLLLKSTDHITDNPQFESENVSESNEALNVPSLNSNEDAQIIEDNTVRNRCTFEIISGNITMTCPDLKFNEDWKLISDESSTTAPLEISHKTDNYENINDYDYIECDENKASQSKDELISNENFDIKKVATPQHDSASTTIELKKNTSEISNDASLNHVIKSRDTIKIDFSTNAKDNQDAIYNANEELTVASVLPFKSNVHDPDPDKRWNLFKIADAQQKNTEKQNSRDFSDFADLSNKNAEILNIDGCMLEQKLVAIYDDEMQTFRKIYGKIMDSHINMGEHIDICHIFPYLCNLSLAVGTQRYADDSTSRKKRMIDNLTWQQEVSNALRENDEIADLMKDLKKIYQKIVVLNACINRFHEEYSFANELDNFLY